MATLDGWAAIEGSVLIVDDDPDMLRLLKIVFEHEHFLATTVETGEQGLQAVTNWTYSLVLSDFWMAEMNGLQFLVELLQREPTYRGSCVLLSCSDVPPDVLEQLPGLGIRFCRMSFSEGHARELIELARKG